MVIEIVWGKWCKYSKGGKVDKVKIQVATFLKRALLVEPFLKCGFTMETHTEEPTRVLGKGS